MFVFLRSTLSILVLGYDVEDRSSRGPCTGDMIDSRMCAAIKTRNRQYPNFLLFPNRWARSLLGFCLIGFPGFSSEVVVFLELEQA
mmetsp:Transcript_20326/g.42624  ORF Transcript_20326/g.42624 Transcript_20326/m.42624 type:complete len:86 (+) Transcript_20326:230-487(+)